MKSTDRFLCELAELPENELKECLDASGEYTSSYILLRQGDQIRAWHNVCPHQGRALNWAPDRFLVDDDHHLICAAHGARFRLPDGLCVGGPCLGASLTPVSVTVTDDHKVMLQT